MGPAQQAASILDDLLRDVEAERGFILFQAISSESEGLVVGRNRQGETGLKAEAWHRAMMESVRENGESWPPEHAASPDFGRDVDPARVLAFPLFLYERVVGAVCVERSRSSAPFAIADRDLLLILSHQIPVAFEIARLMSEREQLQCLVTGQRGGPGRIVAVRAGRTRREGVLEAELVGARDRGREGVLRLEAARCHAPTLASGSLDVKRA